jgi:hypothetical protein
MLRRGVIALALAAGACGCDFWDNPVQGVTLPASQEQTGSASTSFHVYRYPIPGLQPTSVAAVDLFNRGVDDVAIADTSSSEVVVFRNAGNGAFSLLGRFPVCSGATAIDGEDLTGDGYADLLVTCPQQSVLTLLVGDGHGGFERHDIPVTSHPVAALSAPHVSGAGHPYLAVLADTPARLDLFFDQGGGQYTDLRTLDTPEAPTALVSDVFTGDGAVSYAVASGNQSVVSVFLKDGNTYTRSDYDAPAAVSQLAAIDLRDTGISDLVAASGTEGVLRILLNDQSGGFGAHADYDVPGGPASGISTSHLRGISQDELMMQSTLTGDVIIFPNQGGGHLGPPETIHAGSALTGLVSGAFVHHAGDMDLATIDTIKGELVILLNDSADLGGS